jgi:hypothetical protein
VLVQNEGGSSPWTEIAAPVLRSGTTDSVLIQAVIDSLRRSGCVIRRVQAVRPSLEELFLDAVGATPAPSGLPVGGRV